MPRIPRTEASVPIQMADQPNMSPDALTGPGRALQGLGRAISGLAGAFEDTGPTDDQRFAAEMSQVKAYNDMSAWYANYENSYTEDKDPTEYDRAGQAGLRSQLDNVDTSGWHPKQVQAWKLQKEKILGRFRVQGIETAGKRTIVRNVGILENNLKGFIEHLDPDSPQFESELKAFDSRIEGLRGASPADRKRIMDGVAEQLTEKLLKGLQPAKEGDPPPDPGPVIERIQKLQKRWEDILSQQPPPGQPPQGQGVGPQSSFDPRNPKTLFPVVSVTDLNSIPRSGKTKNSREHMGPRGGGHHGGWDIPGKVGDSVIAIDEGVVLSVARDPKGYGDMIDIRYSDGTIHRIAHLGDQRKGGETPAFARNWKAGDKVSPGQEIGYVGYSGNAGKNFPHAHYEVFNSEKNYRKSFSTTSRAGASLRVNPRTYFEQRMAGATLSAGGVASVQARQAGDGGRVVKAVEAGRGYTVLQYDDGRVEKRSGMYGWRNNNPGNIENGSFARKFGGMSGGGRYAVFPTEEDGLRAAEALFFEGKNYRDLSIVDAVRRWAPYPENSREAQNAYAKAMADAAGVSVDARTGSLNAQQRRAALLAQKQAEGNKPGRVVVVKEGAAPSQDAPPVSERGLTQYAGVPKPTQVTDASGRIGAPSGDQIAERVASRVDDNNRPTNTIPGQQTAQEGKLSPQEWSDKDRSSISATQPGLVPNAQAAGGVIQGEPTGILGHAVEKLKKRLPALLEYKAKWDKNQQDRAIVEGQLKGAIPFNPYDKDDTKRLDEQYDMSKITERIVAGDVAAMALAVNNAKTLGYVPPKFRDTLLAMTRDMDPEKVGMRIAGYEMASDIALAFPNAFAGENGGALKREAMDYASMVGTGMGQKEALAWIDEMRTPAWKKKEAENAKFVDAAIKTWDEKEGFDWVAKAVGEELDQDMLSDPVAQSFLIPQMAGEFREAFRRHYIRMPDEASAKERAMAEIKGAYGISRIGEKSTWTPFGNMQGQRLMKYPIENHYPAIGGKPTADGPVPSYDYIEEDVLNSVRSWLNDREQSALDRGVKSVAEVGAPDEDKPEGGSEITMDDIYLVGDDETRRLIEKRNPDEPPSYVIVYRDPKTELLQQIPPEQLRWSMPPQLIKALRDKAILEAGQKQKEYLDKQGSNDAPALDAPAKDTKALELINKIPSGPKLDGSLTGEIGKRLAPLFETNQKPKQPKREMSR